MLEEPAQGPRLRRALDLEGRSDVEEHALGEESVDLFLRRATVAFDRLIQSSELLANDLPDVLVATRRVGLQLDTQQVTIGEEPHIGEAHQVEVRARRIVFGAALGRFVEDQACPLEAVSDDGEEEFTLRPEQLEQIGLRDTDRAGDRFRGCAAVAAGGELSQRGHDDGVPALVCRLPLCGSGVHGT